MSFLLSLFLTVVLFALLTVSGYRTKEEWDKLRENKKVKESSDDLKTSLPTLDEITTLGTRALWSNNYGGDRRSYNLLLSWRDQYKNSFLSAMINSEINRVKDSYVFHIMTIHTEKLHCICKVAPSDTPCSNGLEESTNFLARNVLNHLSPDKRWDERMKAASFLRNIHSSPDKDEINKEEVFNRLVIIITEDPSLGVSKLALETYKILSGYSSSEVFDFEGAAQDWKERKEEILKKNF